MSAATVALTFVDHARSAPTLAAELAGRGYEVGPAVVQRRTQLDSFDGRLRAADIRLEAVEAIDPPAPMRLVMTSPGTAMASIRVRRPPRLIGDLPIGPFRSRLAAPLEMRALLPLGVHDERCIDVIVRSSELAIVAATVREPVDAGLPTVVEVVPSPGRSDQAQRLIAALEDMGVQSSKRSLADLVLRVRGVDPRGVDNSPDVSLAADVAAIDGFRMVFTNLARTITANLPGTVDDIDTEFLHDLRVAIRRTRSVLGLGKGVLTDTARQHFRDEFAWLAGITGPVRDLDVYILEWDHVVGHLAADRAVQLRPVLLHLQRHRAVAQRELVSGLRSERAQALLAEWNATLPDLEPGPRAEHPLRDIVVKKIRAADRAVIEAGRSITSDSPSESLHDLRKDAKKLRYAIECFGGLLPKAERKAFVGQLKELQDNLGRHQDAEVHSAELQRIAHELSDEHATPATLLAVGQLIEHLESEKVVQRADFAERFARYESKQTRRALADLLDSIS